MGDNTSVFQFQPINASDTHTYLQRHLLKDWSLLRISVALGFLFFFWFVFNFRGVGVKEGQNKPRLCLEEQSQ